MTALNISLTVNMMDTLAAASGVLNEGEQMSNGTATAPLVGPQQDTDELGEAFLAHADVH